MFEPREQTRGIHMKTQHSHLRAVVTEDGAAILNSTAGTITTLNSTGAFVWQGLERGEGADMIVQKLAGETGEDADAIQKDVLAFIDAMKKEKLLAR
jgi:hypothetical protein